MSHEVVVTTVFKTLKALTSAFEKLGFEFYKDRTVYQCWKKDHGSLVGDYPLPEGMTEDTVGTCQHAFGLPGTDCKSHADNYQVGVYWDTENNAWRLRFDFYHPSKKYNPAATTIGTRIEKVDGKNVVYTDALNQEYQHQLSLLQSKNNGDQLLEENYLVDGARELVFDCTERMGF